jgi:hypothetical protein
MQLKPDPVVIRMHLEHLFQRPRLDYSEGRVEIACSVDGGAIKIGATFPITPEGLDRATQEAVQRNLEGRNVYVGPNPRSPSTAPVGRCSAEDVERAYWQFGDVDRSDGIALLRKPPIDYTMSVTTGRTPNPRVQPYWGIEDPITNLAAWRAQQAAIADYFHADRVIDPARVMRMAGTVSYPPARKQKLGYVIEQVTLRTLYNDEEREPVSSEDLYRAFPWSNGAASGNGFDHDSSSSDDSAGPQPQGGDRWDTGRKDPLEWVRNIAAGHNLHNNAASLAAHLVNTGHRNWLIRDYLDRLLRPVSDGGTLGQIEELIRSARSKYHTPDPPPEEENFDAPPPIDLYDTLDFDQIAALPPVAYLIQDILTDYGLTVIYGDQSSGKTFLALDMALHLVYGQAWHSFEVSKPTGVLYILGEGVRGLSKRVSAWRHYHGRHQEPAPFRAIPYALDFLDVHAVQKLSRTIGDLILQQHVPIGLVIIDTVARAMNGDENDAEVMSKLVSACDAIRTKYGLAVIGIHHCGKDPALGMRGSTALPRASDTILAVSRVENTMQITVEKQKDDEETPPFELQMRQVPTEPLSTQSSLILTRTNYDQQTRPNQKHNNLTREQIDFIFDEIERAWNANRPWSCMPQTKHEGRYLPKWIASNTGTTLKQALAWVEDWLMNRCIETAIRDLKTRQRGLKVIMRPGTYTHTEV